MFTPIIKYVYPARYVLNQMLVILRENEDKKQFSLNLYFLKNLNRFEKLLKQYNRVTYFDDKPVDAEIYLDASLVGFHA